ncbi:MAG TPA: DJ-1/PfpI family protein [Pyrinomonadaceae bacterium]|nr:DJ-1/PfpI family protein [Pyrinomonadaceae bacterium]
MEMKNVAVLIFDDVEVLDFCGPFEVFSVAGRRSGLDPFNVYTVAESGGPVVARNNLSVNPAHTFSDCPAPDILLVPGGYGTRREMDNPILVDWVKRCAASSELVLSVCTGALILAKCGLLDGLCATTHHGAIELLKQAAPRTEVLPSERIVDNGRIVLSAGISAGIDMSLYVVGRLLGEARAIETAEYMEYDWSGRLKA